MPAKRKFSDETIELILSDFHSDMSGTEVAKQYECDYSKTIRPIWGTRYSPDDVKERHRRLAVKNKTGKSNPMYGKFKEKHHRYKPVHMHSTGYIYVDAPDWYTGPIDKGKAAQHILVACEAAGITQLPEAHVVHHKDEDKLNNHPSNLEIMSRGKHMSKHRWLRYKKKVQRLSRKRVKPKKV